MGIRKRETERIEKENHAFAKRLFDKQAVLNKKQLDVDWQGHQKYKKQIAKMRGAKNLNSASDMQRRTANAYSQEEIQMQQQQQFQEEAGMVGYPDGEGQMYQN